MNTEELILQPSLEELLIFEGTKYKHLIQLKEDGNSYARLQYEDIGVGYLTWIEGKGKGNLLMLGVLKQMIQYKYETLITQVSPREDTSIEQLERFYLQFGLIKDKSLSKRYGRNMFSGKPLMDNTLEKFLKRMTKILNAI